ncbi:MAG: PspC domain-containing protein [Paludibacteraceae bacterium]|nr:PspC domain-containing protein [Paludibacteraceae bacterium]
MAKQLKLSSNKVLLGVCGGIADYFDMDPTVVRVITVILAMCGFVGIGLYLIIWLIITLSNE